MKHAFSTTATCAATESQPVDGQCGWDRMLQHPFLTVCQVGRLPRDIIYPSLMERGGLPDVETVAEKLKNLGIVAPKGFYERIYLDEAFDEGNGFQQW
ncbi:hypothetical protein GCM10023172_43050 [Hymenobacter ginsengisoli]|uniref:Uncharacterized protein n=1 Tax=Hymenobacter ginsengisoli TaxID=1051626 RepID=A0ABP8QTL9_9BACT|nr:MULTISPECIES: hypothetical protein [unclassified Hymenobacter]MBO2033459.1 hypothetical protein [Hymenobacter sp. BT559]